MSSSPTELERPKPQQERSSQRVAEYLATAANLFAEVGYEAATMTAIAERAGSSIGGLYRYFPDKEALATALLERYKTEFETVRSSVLKELKDLSIADFANHLMDRMADFFLERPASFALMASPINTRRNVALHSNLRPQMSKVLLAQYHTLSHEEAVIIAIVVVQIIKGMVASCAEVESRRRSPIIREFKRALTNYLTDVLRSS